MAIDIAYLPDKIYFQLSTSSRIQPPHLQRTQTEDAWTMVIVERGGQAKYFKK